MNQNKKKDSPIQLSRKNINNRNIFISDLLVIIANNLKTILVIPILFCSMTILYLIFFSVPSYTSTSKILSGGSSNTTNISTAMGLASQFGIDLPSAQNKEKWVYPEIIKSRLLMRKLLALEFYSESIGKKTSLFKIFNQDKNEKD